MRSIPPGALLALTIALLTGFPPASAAPIVAVGAVAEAEPAEPISDNPAASPAASSAEGGRERATPLLPQGASLPSRALRSPEEQREAGAGDSWLWRTGASLGVVLALIFVLRWLMRKTAGRAGGFRHQLGAGGRAPAGVLFVLGRYPVSRGHSLVLLRLDRRVLLVSQTASGMRTLTELTDPREVASIIQQTQDEEGASLSARFTSLLKRFEKDSSILDEDAPSGPPPAQSEVKPSAFTAGDARAKLLNELSRRRRDAS